MTGEINLQEKIMKIGGLEKKFQSKISRNL